MGLIEIIQNNKQFLISTGIVLIIAVFTFFGIMHTDNSLFFFFSFLYPFIVTFLSVRYVLSHKEGKDYLKGGIISISQILIFFDLFT